MLIDGYYWYDKSNSNHVNNSWSYGPFCYKIKDVYRLTDKYEHKGQLGCWMINNNVIKKILRIDKGLKDILNKWNQLYGNKLFKEKDKNIYRAITILQPFAEAILLGIKTVENKKRPTFRLSNTDVISKPSIKQCRFCDINGNCNFWLHKGSIKRVKRKRKNKTLNGKRKRRRIENNNIDSDSVITDDIDIKWNELVSIICEDDGRIPMRCCPHCKIIMDIHEAEDIPPECYLCDDGNLIEFDHYYSCPVNCVENIDNILCFRHTHRKYYKTNAFQTINSIAMRDSLLKSFKFELKLENNDILEDIDLNIDKTIQFNANAMNVNIFNTKTDTNIRYGLQWIYLLHE